MWRDIASVVMLVAGMCFTGFVAWLGFEALIWPSRSHRRWNREVFEASEPEETLYRNRLLKARNKFLQLEQRIVGFLFLLAGAGFTYLFAWGLWSGARISSSSPHSFSGPGTSPDAGSLLLGLFSLCGGAYILLRTETFVRWTFRLLYSRRIRDDAMPSFVARARALGALCLFAGILTCYFWVRRF